MNTRIAIDRGNTSTKLSLWDAATDEFVRGEIIAGQLTLQAVKDFVGEDCPVACGFCSVADRDPEFEAALASLWPTIVIDAQTPQPLKIDYNTPESLGADRISAAVGAYSMFPANRILVVDIGTAITYDIIEPGTNALKHEGAAESEEGAEETANEKPFEFIFSEPAPEPTFAGGNISPGLGMRLQALHDHTSRLPRVETPREFKVEFLFGEDTTQAILQGCILGILAELELYYDQLWDYDTKFVLSGRTATLISPQLGYEHVLDEHLVGRGINAILKYNGK